MFYTDGFIPVCDLYSTVYEYHLMKAAIDRRSAKGEIIKVPITPDANFMKWFDLACVEVQELSSLLIWDFFENVPFFNVILANGKLIKVSQAIAKSDDRRSTFGRHLSLGIGTVGSGLTADSAVRKTNKNNRISMLELDRLIARVERKTYGSFLDHHVLVKREFVGNFLSEFELQLDRVANDDCAAQIVRQFDADPSLTKAAARVFFGAGMKVTEFNAVWEAAATKRPQLSKPGPRKAKPFKK